jgi:hypothetical protein
MVTAFAEFRGDLTATTVPEPAARGPGCRLRREREALVATVQRAKSCWAPSERSAVVLSQTDAISQRLADHVMNS